MNPMMIFQRAIPRRTFLRGMGATVALPLLEGMIPALAGAGGTAESVTRLGIVYFPNGAIMDKWKPVAPGSAYELPPILEPLARFRENFLVLGGLDSNQAWGKPGDVAGEHPRAAAAFLTGVHVNSSVREPRAGISLDQIVAQEFKKHTELASLELGLESSEILGTCDGSCTYQNTICWSAATTPLPMENQPRAVFERLFGGSETTSKTDRLARIQKNRSLLDFLTQDTARLLGDLGPSDRTKVNQYLEAIRDVERRIQKAEEQSSRELPVLQRPAGIPPTFTEHIKLMFDLMVLAYQCDLTRVCTLQLGHEMSAQTYPEIGIHDPYHPLTHHQGDPEKIAKSLKVNIYHAELFGYFLEKLRSTPDGDGSLLDHSLIVYGGGLSDGNKHFPVDLPVLLAGGGSGQVKGGRHIRYPEHTPLANLHLALLDMLGIPLEKFADSNGRLSLI